MNLERLDYWLNRSGVAFALPQWLVDLFVDIKFPYTYCQQKIRWQQFLKGAALYGSSLGDKVLIGQVSVYDAQDAPIYTIRFRDIDEAKVMEEFGREICVWSPAATVRTAIMLGLELQGAERGIMSPTRHNPFTLRELQTLWQTWNNNICSRGLSYVRR